MNENNQVSNNIGKKSGLFKFMFCINKYVETEKFGI